MADGSGPGATAREPVPPRGPHPIQSLISSGSSLPQVTAWFSSNDLTLAPWAPTVSVHRVFKGPEGLEGPEECSGMDTAMPSLVLETWGPCYMPKAPPQAEPLPRPAGSRSRG